MAKQFGEQVDDKTAYDTARGATKHMSTETLKQQAGQEMGPNQEQAVKDELAARNDS